MSKVQITSEAIAKALKNGTKSMSELYRALGGKSKVSGSFSRKIRSICTNVDAQFKANKGQASGTTEKSATPAKRPATPAKATKPTKKQAKPAKQAKAHSSKYKRHPQNPYRPGSSYSVAFDILATKKDGISRNELTNLLSKETGKPVKNAGFDLSVVLSPTESFMGARHRSARDGYFVKKEESHYTLMLPSLSQKN